MTEPKFDERKEVVSRVREPIKIKAVPYATTKIRGHQIQLELNLSWQDIDQMTGKDSDIVAMAIQNAKDFITDVLDSRYLGVQKVEN